MGVLSDGEVAVGWTGKLSAVFTSSLAQPVLLAFLCVKCVCACARKSSGLQTRVCMCGSVHVCVCVCELVSCPDHTPRGERGVVWA